MKWKRCKRLHWRPVFGRYTIRRFPCLGERGRTHVLTFSDGQVGVVMRVPASVNRRRPFVISNGGRRDMQHEQCHIHFVVPSALRIDSCTSTFSSRDTSCGLQFWFRESAGYGGEAKGRTRSRPGLFDRGPAGAKCGADGFFAQAIEVRTRAPSCEKAGRVLSQ